MSRIVSSLLLMVVMFFPVWGPLLYFDVIKNRLRIRNPNLVTVIDTTVKFWAINLVAVDLAMLMIFLATVFEPTETRGAEIYRLVQLTWGWGKYVLGALAASNFLISSYLLHTNRQASDEEAIGFFYLAPVAVGVICLVLYLAWKMAFTLTGVG